MPLGSTTYYFATKEELLQRGAAAVRRRGGRRGCTRPRERFEGVSAPIPTAVVDAIAGGDRQHADAASPSRSRSSSCTSRRRGRRRWPRRRRRASRRTRRSPSPRCARAARQDPERLAPLFIGLIEGLMFRQLVDPRSDWVDAVLKPQILALFEAVGLTLYICTRPVRLPPAPHPPRLNRRSFLHSAGASAFVCALGGGGPATRATRQGRRGRGVRSRNRPRSRRDPVDSLKFGTPEPAARRRRRASTGSRPSPFTWDPSCRPGATSG